jgi:hypothetical protein
MRMQGRTTSTISTLHNKATTAQRPHLSHMLLMPPHVIHAQLQVRNLRLLNHQRSTRLRSFPTRSSLCTPRFRKLLPQQTNRIVRICMRALQLLLNILQLLLQRGELLVVGCCSCCCRVCGRPGSSATGAALLLW